MNTSSCIGLPPTLAVPRRVNASTVVDRCSHVTPIDHAKTGAARPGAAEDSLPSVMLFAPRGAARRTRTATGAR
jgi:hypothetical protein